MIWGGGMFVGPFSLVVVPILLVLNPGCFSFTLAIVTALLMFAPDMPESPMFSRLYLRTASLLRGGSTIWVHDSVVPHVGDGVMVCYHPHGVIPLGFTLNGAIRAKTRQPSRYLPEGVSISHKVSGVQAPVLFK